MITKKEAIDEIVFMWKHGEKNAARFLVRMYKHIIPPDIYQYLHKQTGIINNETIPESVLEASSLTGEKVYNQYGDEIVNPWLEAKNSIPKFKK
jgi:hypothetical protein